MEWRLRAEGHGPGTVSAIRALVRVQAEKNGHNIEVVEAMIDKTKEFK